MKRIIRQRCGFGCVICGVPFYEYEHMLKWSVVKRHVASEITLLCRYHHGLRTDNLLPVEIVRDANRAPHNLNGGEVKKAEFFFIGREANILLGGNSFNLNDIRDGEKFWPVVIDGVPMVSFSYSKGRLYLSLNLFDDDNRLALKVLDNEILFDAGAWDVQWVAQTLTIRQSHKNIVLKIKFVPPGKVIIEKGRILYNGIELIIGRDYLYNSNLDVLWQGCVATNCNYGISLGDPPLKGVAGFSLINIKRDTLDRLDARKRLRDKLRNPRGL